MICVFCGSPASTELPIIGQACEGCNSALNQKLVLEGLIQSETLAVIAEKMQAEFTARTERLIRIAKAQIDGLSGIH